jgi:hypothetical protein
MKPADRARDISSLTWEPPVAIAAGTFIVSALSLPLAQALVSLVCGGGWAWPSIPARPGLPPILSGVTGLMHGHPGRGLTPAQAQHLPSATVIYAAAFILESIALTCLVAIVRYWWSTAGPGSYSGMATKSDTEHVLGITRLQDNAAIIRPDLQQPRDHADRRPS